MGGKRVDKKYFSCTITEPIKVTAKQYDYAYNF